MKTRLQFFNHFLKGAANGWDRQPRVRLAITEAGPDPVVITAEETWPPTNVEWRKLWLHAGAGTLSFEQPPVTASVSAAFPKERIGFLWTVPEDTDVIGHMALYLNLEVREMSDALLFAGVRKIHAGVETVFEGSYGFSGDMVSKGWQRAAHREVDSALSTPEQPVYTHRKFEHFKPGEIVPVAISLRPHATRLRKGDYLRVDLQGHWFYPKSIFRGQFPADYQRSGKALCIFHTGPDHPAYLLLATRTPTSDHARRA